MARKIRVKKECERDVLEFPQIIQNTVVQMRKVNVILWEP